MDISRTLSEIVQYFLFLILFLILGVLIGILIISLVIQDSLIFIYKRTGELLWQKKQ